MDETATWLSILYHSDREYSMYSTAERIAAVGDIDNNLSHLDDGISHRSRIGLAVLTLRCHLSGDFLWSHLLFPLGSITKL